MDMILICHLKSTTWPENLGERRSTTVENDAAFFLRLLNILKSQTVCTLPLSLGKNRRALLGNSAFSYVIPDSEIPLLTDAENEDASSAVML